jgi:uncharacterized protein
MSEKASLIQTVLEHFPAVQAIYLFGSHGTGQEWPESDVDIGLLLAPEEAKRTGRLGMHPLQDALEDLFKKEIDLINLRRVPTVLQKEVIAAENRLYAGNPYAADEFEMLVLSSYQKLNEERAGIIESALADGRFHAL